MVRDAVLEGMIETVEGGQQPPIGPERFQSTGKIEGFFRSLVSRFCLLPKPGQQSRGRSGPPIFDLLDRLLSRDGRSISIVHRVQLRPFRWD